MKITRGKGNRGVVLWVVIALFVIMVVVIGTIFVLMVQTIKRIVPPPANGQVTLGMPYMGGVVVGRDFPPTGLPQGFTFAPVENISEPQTVDIYAGDTPWSVTNWIWSGPLSEMETNANGLPVEQWTNGMPPMRFYRFEYNP